MKDSGSVNSKNMNNKNATGNFSQQQNGQQLVSEVVSRDDHVSSTNDQNQSFYEKRFEYLNNVEVSIAEGAVGKPTEPYTGFVAENHVKTGGYGVASRPNFSVNQGN